MKKLLLFLTVLMMVGWAARKVIKSQVEVKQETTSTIKEEVSQVSEKSKSLIDTTSVIEESFEPIDSSKPMLIDRKNGIFQNTRFKATKTKKGMTILKKEDNVLNQSKETLNEVSTDIETKDKEADRKSNLPWWLILVIIGIILGYIEYRKEWYFQIVIIVNSI